FFLLECDSKLTHYHPNWLNFNSDNYPARGGCSEIDNRDFHDWTMGYIPASSTTKPVTLKFSATSAFSPYEMTGNSAYLLLLELKSKLPNI
ncbi:hypothetical protein ACSTEL_22170, partial [Vibrio vulnificus]